MNKWKISFFILLGTIILMAQQPIANLWVAATSLPTAASNGAAVNAMSDKFGRSVMVPNTVRDLIGSVGVQSTSSSASSMISAGGSSVFNDIISIGCSNEGSTATVVTISDNGSGGNTYLFNVAGQAGAYGGIPLTSPIPQGTSNAAWDIKNSGSATLDCVVVYAKNK